MGQSCSILQGLLADYLNAVAVEHRLQADEERAFAQVAQAVARARTEQAARAREVVRRAVIDHCGDHGCLPVEELVDITEDCHQRAVAGHRRR